MKHKSQLDGLRAAAVVAVLTWHLWPELPVSGHRGVQLFFVLSGFLITSILLDCRTAIETGTARFRAVLGNFYARRLLRIAPAYYIVLLVLALVPSSGIQSNLPWHVAYLSNFYLALQGAWEPWPIIHLWSLATEEQFYLLWPLLILRLPRRAIAPAVLCVVAGSVISRWLGERAGLQQGTTLWVLPWASFDALGMGAFLALIAERPRARRVLGRIALAAAFAIGLHQVALAAAWIESNFAFSYVAIELTWSVAFAGLVLRAATGIPGVVGTALASRPAVYLGRISYGIYLYHVPLHFLGSVAARRLGVPFPASGPVAFVLFGGLSIAVAALSWRYVEAPVNRLKHRFPYRARGFPPGSAGAVKTVSKGES